MILHDVTNTGHGSLSLSLGIFLPSILQNAIIVLVRSKAMFHIYKLSICCISLPKQNLWLSCLYVYWSSESIFHRQFLKAATISTLISIYCMLHRIPVRKVKCHVWKIGSSNFLFVKRGGRRCKQKLLC